MALLGKKIIEQPVDIGSSINPNYIIVDTLDVSYNDITSISNFKLYGELSGKDYLVVRDGIKNILTTIQWSGCTNAEKDIIIDYYLDDTNIASSANTTNKIAHMMIVNGLSQADAITYLYDVFGSHHIKDVKNCKDRADSAKIYSIIAKYLVLNDGRDFFQTVRNLYLDYKEQAIKGTTDGDVGVGLFDYIESTVGTIYEFTGLSSKGYDMVNGDLDETNFIFELMDVFRNGNI